MPRYTNAGVAQAWARQGEWEGHSNNGNFWFRDKSIYSYSTIMATILTIGTMTIMIENRESYSVTTSGKHQNEIRSAPFDFTLPAYDGGGRRSHDIITRIESLARAEEGPPMNILFMELLPGYDEQIEEAKGRAARARKNKDWHLSRVAEFERHKGTIATLMGLKPEDFNAWAVAQKTA